MAKVTRESLEEPERIQSHLSRRHFLSWLGWGSIALSVGGVATGSAAYLQPRLTYEPTSTSVAGRAEDYKVGEMRAFDV